MATTFSNQRIPSGNLTQVWKIGILLKENHRTKWTYMGHLYYVYVKLPEGSLNSHDYHQLIEVICY